jgi:hypothetical protein
MTDEVLNNPIAESYWRAKIAQELEALEVPKDISSDYFAATKRTKMAAISIAKFGLPE